MLARINEARNRGADAAASLSQRREFIHRAMDQRVLAVAAAAPEIQRTDRTVSVEGGEVAIRVYRPVDATGPLPGHVYVHGGGWWLGTLDHRDRVCASRAANVGCVVVSVAHRLAPEHRYPVPVEDVYAALGWTAANAARLHIDASRLSIGGDSSGANLAAAAALMSRDRDGPTLLAQVLEIPVLDLTLSQPSIEAYSDGYALTRRELADHIDQYCSRDQRRDPYASPALGSDLAGLSPALIMTAEYDLPRDDGELYGRRLNEAGTPAEVIRWAGHIHGSHEMTAVLPSARDWQARVESFLGEANRNQP
jgi:acetyl esterase